MTPEVQILLSLVIQSCVETMQGVAYFTAFYRMTQNYYYFAEGLFVGTSNQVCDSEVCDTLYKMQIIYCTTPRNFCPADTISHKNKKWKFFFFFAWESGMTGQCFKALVGQGVASL